jgi:FKBP-type peptidyl-prolyl cis-trans isomerase 2
MKLNKKLLIILVLIIVGVGGVGFAYWAHTSKFLLRVKPGLLVELNWIARDEEGVVQDTNIYELAKDEGLPLRSEEFYKPLKFEVGKGPVKGIDEGVLGMRIGDEKTVRIPPEKGFAGVRAFAWLDREEEIPTLETFPREELEKRLGIGKYKLGQILPHYLGGWRVVITELTLENVTIRSPVIRGRYSWQMFPGWNVTVLEVTPEEIVLRYEPELGLVFKAQEGGFPFLEPLIYRVKKVTEQKIKLIYNPYESIANKTLEVGLTVVDIEKPGSGKES